MTLMATKGNRGAPTSEVAKLKGDWIEQTQLSQKSNFWKWTKVHP
jgi:hypothetical protein